MARKKIKDASFIGPDAVLSIDKADPERTSLHIPLPSGLDMAESADDGEREERRRKDDDTETGDESQQSGESGSGGGVVFDETEDDFDQTELQGMQIPIFRKALKKGLKLVSRVTEHRSATYVTFYPIKICARAWSRLRSARTATPRCCSIREKSFNINWRRASWSVCVSPPIWKPNAP